MKVFTTIVLLFFLASASAFAQQSKPIDMRTKDNEQDLKMYRYECLAPATDFVLAVDNRMLRCFALDRESGVLADAELPFELLSPMQFNKEEFDEEHGYWRVDGYFYEYGDIMITASPSMSYLCSMIALYDGKGGFNLYRRAGYDFISFEITKDNAETEIYVQNFIRPNFQRINAITDWAWVEKGAWPVSATQDANLVLYYSQNGLEKMVAKLNDKTSDRVIEYYFLDGLLSFVYEVTTQSGVKTERRWYLKNNTCFRGLGDKGKKLTPTQIEAEFLSDKGAYSYYTLFLFSTF